jgi:GNAT superfamily N-acetyltransferase
MQVMPASIEDIFTYAALARAAQAWLQARGLGQYVPAAHDEYAAAIRSRVESGTLYVVRDNGEAVGFFSLDLSPFPWWPADETPAVYLAGMVVARSARGIGVGSYIIEWCAAEAARLQQQFVRLDCHADNPWLCHYYEAHGFELWGRVDQRPGYHGCLYQRVVASPVNAPACDPVAAAE